MKRLLVVAVLFTAVSQIQASRSGLLLGQKCSSGFKVQNLANGSYQCSGNNSGSGVQLFCPKNGYSQPQQVQVLGGKKGTITYQCQKLVS